MLANTSRELLEEWKIFEELDPDLDDRLDWGLAHVVQAIMRDGKQLREFMLPLGDYPKDAVVPQTIQYQEMLLDQWISSSNAIFQAKAARRS